jgi:hypothetical protein
MSLDLSKFGEPTTEEPGHCQDSKTGKVYLVVQGRKIEIPSLEASDFDALERHYKERVLSPVAAIEAAMPELQKASPAVREYALAQFYQDLKKGAELREVDQRALSAWMDTRPGMLVQLHLQLRKRIPDLTLPDVETLLTGIKTDALAMARRNASARLREIGEQAIKDGTVDKLLGTPQG